MLKSAQNKEIIFFRLANGNEPFGEWVEDIRDAKTRRRILQRVFRMQTGNYGDCKSLKEGVFELRLMFGSGYRIYFGEDGQRLVVLLCGGDKSTQSKDVSKAQAYWKEYLSNASI